MPIQVSFSTDNLTPEEARWIASLVQPAEVSADRFVVANPTPGATLEVHNGEPKIVLPPVALAEETVEGHISEVAAIPATDSRGLPWDERIHASSKALNADGTWRTKRGVDKALVASVEAELRGAQIDAAVAEVTGQVDAQVVSVEVSEPDSEGRVEAVMVVAPPPPPAPEAPLAPVVTQSPPVETAAMTPSAPSSSTSPFVALMKRVTTAQSAGKLTQPRVKELLESMEKKSIMDLRTDTDALDAFAVLLTAELDGTLAEVAEACGGLKPENIAAIIAIVGGGA